MAQAMDWVSRITTVGLEMVLPGFAGWWLGERWGVPMLAVVGFGLGMVVGFWHLLVMTGAVGGKGKEAGKGKVARKSTEPKPPVGKDTRA